MKVGCPWEENKSDFYTVCTALDYVVLWCLIFEISVCIADLSLKKMINKLWVEIRATVSRYHCPKHTSVNLFHIFMQSTIQALMTVKSK